MPVGFKTLDNCDAKQAVTIPDINDPTIFKPLIGLDKLQPETLSYLKDWRPPNWAYVLFEKVEYRLGQDMSFRKGTGLMTLNVEARPEQESKLYYYVHKKKFRIIHWGNFPKFDDRIKSRADRATMYSGGSGVNPWDMLENVCKDLMNSNSNWKAEKEALLARVQSLSQQNSAFQDKIAGYQALEAEKKQNERPKDRVPKPN